MTTVVLEGNADADVGRYLFLPFEVPVGCRRIDVSYSFGGELGAGEGGAGGAGGAGGGGRPGSGAEPDILDLGLVDPGFGESHDGRFGEGSVADGFRGWSGGFRRAVFIEERHATPGYLPGPLVAGTWHVVLGLARVGAVPCPYRVEVGLSFERPAAGPGAGWYRGDLQSHTHHSDAKGSLLDLRQAARERSLDFLAVTDHNTVSHHRHLPELSAPDLLLVPGMELTSYFGHANVWGAVGAVDFRLGSDADVAVAVATVHRCGGLFSVNHPKYTPGCIGCDWTFAVPEGADSLEAWQGPWLQRNWESLARYDDVLRTGRRLTLVGGSDRHQPGWPDPDPVEVQLGSPTTWLWLDELSVAGVLGAIRSGRGFVSASPQGPFIELTVDGVAMGGSVGGAARGAGEADAVRSVRCRVAGAAGEVLSLVGAAGEFARVEVAGDEFVFESEVRLSGPFVRAEVVAGASLPGIRDRVEEFASVRGLPWGITVAEVFAQPYRLALSNPVYLR